MARKGFRIFMDHCNLSEKILILPCSSAVVLEVDMGRFQNFHILIKRIKCTLRGLFDKCIDKSQGKLLMTHLRIFFLVTISILTFQLNCRHWFLQIDIWWPIIFWIVKTCFANINRNRTIAKGCANRLRTIERNSWRDFFFRWTCLILTYDWLPWHKFEPSYRFIAV